MARPRKTTRRKASRKRQPKRILNVNPSPKTEEDWTFETRRGGGHGHGRTVDPGFEGPPFGLVEDRRPGLDGLLRRLGVRRLAAPLALRQDGRIAQTDVLSPRFIWMASKETDPFITRPTTFIEAEGTSLKAALDIARKFGVVRDSVLPFAPAGSTAGQANTFYALAAQLKILAYFNLGTNQTSWRTWLATKGPILTRLNVDATWDASTENDGNLDDYQPDRPTAATRSRFVGYRPGGSSSATAGARAGATRASPTPRSPTPRRRSPRRTASRYEVGEPDRRPSRDVIHPSLSDAVAELVRRQQNRARGVHAPRPVRGRPRDRSDSGPGESLRSSA